MEYSLADIKAAVDDGDDDGFFGGAGAFWLIWVIVILLFFVWNNHNRESIDNARQNCATQSAVYNTSNGVEKSVLNSQYQTLLGFKDGQLQSSENAAKAQLQLSECCCENRLAICQQTNALQSAIAEQGQMTRDLIQANTIQALRDSLNGANTTLANQVLANSIVNQIKPCPIPAYITCSPYATYPCCNGTTF